MLQSFTNIGFDHVICTNRVLAVLPPGMAATRNRMKKAKEEGKFLLLTMGREIRSVILLDEGTVIASPVHTVTLAKRLNAAARHDEVAKQNILHKTDSADPEEDAEFTGYDDFTEEDDNTEEEDAEG